MKFNNYISLFILSMAFLGVKTTIGMDNKIDSNNIIHNNEIKIIEKKHIMKLFPLTRVTLTFYAGDILLAESRYNFNNGSTCADMDHLEVKREYRSRGLGEQIFYKTMYHIHKNNPKIEDVDWFISPHDPPKNMSLTEAFQLLFKFYRRVGATVDEYMGKGYINLKEAGYFDEN